MTEVKSMKTEADDIIRYVKEGKLAEIRNRLKELRNPEDALNTYGQGGHTPLWRATKEGNEEIVDFMISRGGDPGIRDRNSGQGNCLHVAAEFKHPSLVKYFIDLHMEVDVPRREKEETALWLACSSGCIESVRLLIDAGANIHAANSEGVDCYEAARQHTYLPILALLRDQGYDPGDRPVTEVLDETPRRGFIVEHPTFGRGKILSTTGYDDHLKYEIEFDDEGIKLMLARFVQVIGPGEDMDDDDFF